MNKSFAILVLLLSAFAFSSCSTQYMLTTAKCVDGQWGNWDMPSGWASSGTETDFVVYDRVYDRSYDRGYGSSGYGTRLDLDGASDSYQNAAAENYCFRLITYIDEFPKDGMWHEYEGRIVYHVPEGAVTKASGLPSSGRGVPATGQSNPSLTRAPAPETGASSTGTGASAPGRGVTAPGQSASSLNRTPSFSRGIQSVDFGQMSKYFVEKTLPRLGSTGRTISRPATIKVMKSRNELCYNIMFDGVGFGIDQETIRDLDDTVELLLWIPLMIVFWL